MPPSPREGSLHITHPVYSAFQSSWLMLKDIYEGTGGFIDEHRPYLVPHPREWLDHSVQDAVSQKWSPKENPSQPSPKLKMRRKLARYENLAATILDQVVGALFLQSPKRTFAEGKSNPQITAFWDNVDGKGKDMTAFMRESWTVSGVFGHAAVLVEKPEVEAVTAADMQLPKLCRYMPLDVIDWLDDGEGQLTSVKLAELAPRGTYDEKFTAKSRLRVRVVDADGWRLYGPQGLVDQADHGFGELPIEVLYARRRLMTPFVGKSVIGDPQLHIDYYNLTSEVRELLRNQTFAILNVPIGEKGSVESEQTKLGQQSGTSNVLFSTNAAAYLSPEGTNVEAYHTALDRLARMIYRLASAPWEGDSRDAESADSRKIKRSEQEQVLKSHALELQGSERRLLELAYIALYGEAGRQRMEDEGATVTYPDTFGPVDMASTLADVTAAVALDLGETATKELKKRTARALLPDANKELAEAIDKELDAQEYLSKADEREQDMEVAAKKFAGSAAA